MVSGVVTEVWGTISLNFVLSGNSWKLKIPKMQSLGLKPPILGKFRCKIKILSTRNFLQEKCATYCQKFVAFCWEIANSCSAYFLIHDPTAIFSSPSYYTVSQKSIPDIFDYNLKTNYLISIIFGTNISDTTCHHMTIQFPTLPNVCFCTTYGKQIKRNGLN